MEATPTAAHGRRFSPSRHLAAAKARAAARAGINPEKLKPQPATGTCTVCLEELSFDDETLIRMPCQHFFHRSCVETWLYEHDTCPVCRMQVSKPMQRLMMLAQQSRVKRLNRRRAQPHPNDSPAGSTTVGCQVRDPGQRAQRLARRRRADQSGAAHSDGSGPFNLSSALLRPSREASPAIRELVDAVMPAPGSAAAETSPLLAASSTLLTVVQNLRSQTREEADELAREIEESRKVWATLFKLLY